MASTSSVTIQTSFSGDNVADLINSALNNASSPAEQIITTLLVGANTITAPVVSGVVVTGLMIIPPAGNTVIITLKGVSGDTGFPLHITNPSYIPVDPTFTSLILSVGTQINGVRLVWS